MCGASSRFLWPEMGAAEMAAAEMTTVEMRFSTIAAVATAVIVENRIERGLDTAFTTHTRGPTYGVTACGSTDSAITTRATTPAPTVPSSSASCSHGARLNTGRRPEWRMLAPR